MNETSQIKIRIGAEDFEIMNILPFTKNKFSILKDLVVIYDALENRLTFL